MFVVLYLRFCVCNFFIQNHTSVGSDLVFVVLYLIRFCVRNFLIHDQISVGSDSMFVVLEHK